MNASVKNRKEAKNLRKYDSNSIDEEEFQDCKYIYTLDLFKWFTE